MSSYLRATHLIDLCTQSISYDRQVQSACKSFDAQMWEIIDDTGQVIMIPDIMNLEDETLVDILAWQFHVDFYDTTKDLEFKKKLVQMSIVWHRTKGTLALVQDVIDTYWPGGAHIEEWYQYRSPLPPNYPIEETDTMVGIFDTSFVDLVNNRFNWTNHGLSNNNQVRFMIGPLGVLPSPLVVGMWYFIRNSTTDTFQLSAQGSGALIQLSTVGEAANAMWLHGVGGSWHDRYKFRITLDQQQIAPEDQVAVLALIDRYKPVSRWCEGLYRAVTSECDIGTTGMLLRFVYRESEPPDDWSPGPEPPPPPTYYARLNKLLDPVLVEIDAENPVAATLYGPTGELITNINAKVDVKIDFSKSVGPATLSGHIPGGGNPHKVHFVYIVPSDKTDRASDRVMHLAYELQRWLRWRLNGKTITLCDPVVEVYHTSHDAAWYSTHYIGGGQTGGTLQVGQWYHIVTYQAGDNFLNVGAPQNATGVIFQATGTTPSTWTHGSLLCNTNQYYWINGQVDLHDYAGGGFYQEFNSWFCYIDAPIGPNQSAGGTGGGYMSGVCILHGKDVDALMGVDPDWTVCREIGGAGHELLHTFSMPHAQPAYWQTSIMGIGYMNYPSCIMSQDDYNFLFVNGNFNPGPPNPFFTDMTLEEMHAIELCYFDDQQGT